MRKYFPLKFQIETVTNILMLLDQLDAHKFKYKKEIEVLEGIQDSLMKKYERSEKKRKEAKK
jgi:hypothetical protein